MKCPVCQAKLLPVDGELFCLQCGNAVAIEPGMEKQAEAGAPLLEETSDPVLQRAIVDAVHHAVTFRLPVSAAPPARPVGSFAPMRAILAPPRPVLAGGASGGAVAHGPAVAVKATAADKAMAVAAPVTETAKSRRRLGLISRGWAVGAAAFMAFAGLNMGLNSYFANRVYPGVVVGTVGVGGVPLSEVKARLAAAVPQAALKVRVGQMDFVVNPQSVGSADMDATVRDVTNVGRTTPLPLAGIIWSLVSKPLTVRYVVDDDAVRNRVAEIADEVDRPAADAVALVRDGRAFVVNEKPGLRLDRDKLTDLIRKNIGKSTEVAFEPARTDAVITAGSLSDEIEAAQSRLMLNLQLKVKNTTYAIGPSDITGWLVVGGSGNSLQIDNAKIATYVNGLPGKFDRQAAAAALMDAVKNGAALSYTANTKKNVSASLPASIAVPNPRMTYKYCVLDQTGANKAALEERTAAVTSATGGWGLGGALAFEAAQKGCNVTVQLTRSAQMKAVDPACDGQSTCQVGAVVAVNADRWAAAPSGWGGTLDSYREELLRHEVGHWLGFDHASCTSPVSPISQATIVTMPGCSPNWYAIPAETQGTKVLPGF